ELALTCWKNSLRARIPPAEAPIPTIRNSWELGREERSAPDSWTTGLARFIVAPGPAADRCRSSRCCHTGRARGDRQGGAEWKRPCRTPSSRKEAKYSSSARIGALARGVRACCPLMMDVPGCGTGTFWPQPEDVIMVGCTHIAWP